MDTIRRIPFDRSELERLLGSRLVGRLDASELAARAHRRWNLKQYRAAAVLFCAAAERADLEPAGRFGRQYLSYYSRAAVTFSLAGDLAVATPMLRAVTAFDWDSEGVSNDSHFTEWAFVELLDQAAILGPDSFRSEFANAVARCRSLGWEFPSIHPKQEHLLRVALALQTSAIVDRIVTLIRSRRPITRAARMLLLDAGRWLQRTAGVAPSDPQFETQ